MPAKVYRLSPLAKSDLEGIWFYTFRQWFVHQADTYISSFVAVFEELASGTKSGLPSDARPNYKKYLCGSHMIYFLEYLERIDIIRVLHQRQDVGRHLEY